MSGPYDRNRVTIGFIHENRDGITLAELETFVAECKRFEVPATTPIRARTSIKGGWTKTPMLVSIEVTPGE